MKKHKTIRTYWDKAACDPQVDKKYICDIGTKDDFYKAIGKLPGVVLEIGCGVGRLTRPWSFGIDVSPEMLAIARQRNPQGDYQPCDGKKIPYSDGFFGSVFCVLVFQHNSFEVFQGYVAEVSRVLKDGGIFSFQYIIGEKEGEFSHHYNDEDVKKTLKDNGFNIISEKTGLIHHQWTWVRAEKAVFDTKEKDDLK